MKQHHKVGNRQIMKKVILILIILAVGLAGGCAKVKENSQDKSAGEQLTVNFKTMRLISPQFANNQFIPSKYTCDGQDVNPPLLISNVPAGTKSLVLIVDDPDAPRGDWVHWLVWNIRPETAEIKENSLPGQSVAGLTDFGSNGWGGPCPPAGVHHYQFKLYALDNMLDIETSAQKNDLEKAMQGHILEQTVLVGLYER